MSRVALLDEGIGHYADEEVREIHEREPVPLRSVSNIVGPRSAGPRAGGRLADAALRVFRAVTVYRWPWRW